MKNLEIEKSVLSMLILDADLMLENEVNESDFTTAIHKQLFSAIQECGANYAMIQGRFREEDADYIAMVASLSLGTWRRSADWQELKRLSELRRIASLAKGIQIAAADGQDLDVIYEKIHQFEKQDMRTANIKEVLTEIVAELT